MIRGRQVGRRAGRLGGQAGRQHLPGQAGRAGRNEHRASKRTSGGREGRETRFDFRSCAGVSMAQLHDKWGRTSSCASLITPTVSSVMSRSSPTIAAQQANPQSSLRDARHRVA
eukprot:SAG11_NODE_75_length_18024_cov_5.885356_18_plen_114_part_00